MSTLPEIEAKLRTTPDPSNSQLNTWFTHLVKNQMVFVLQAQNEQNPIPESELGYPIRPMPTKAANHHEQVGDYQFMVKNTWGSFLVERKSVQDLYGTLYGGRERFYSEVDRFYADKRFDQFIVMVEGTYKEFLEYVPPRKACKFCDHFRKNVGGAKDVGICVHPSHGKLVKMVNDSCRVFVDMETPEQRISGMLNSKKATIDALQVRPDVQVIFCESRQDMIEQYRDMIKQWTMQNFRKIIGCGTYAPEMSMSQPRVMDEVRL